MLTDVSERLSLRAAALLAAICLAASFVALYYFAVRTYLGQSIDVTLFSWWGDLVGMPGVADQATVVRAGAPLVLGLACALLTGAALVHRRWREMVASVLVVALSVGLARMLRTEFLDRPLLGDMAYVDNTFPSGHVAATAALAVALALLAPRPARRLVAVAGAAIAVAAGPASIVSHAHRPSDVAASFLLVAAVACLVGAFALPDAGRRRLRLPGGAER